MAESFMMKVVKDGADRVVHFGPWDYQPIQRMKRQPVVDEKGEIVRIGTGLPYLDRNGNAISDGRGGYARDGTGEPMMEEVPDGEPEATRPLPEGCFEDEIEVVRGADGAYYDPREYGALRRAEYAGLPLGDQLDAVLKFAQQMKAQGEVLHPDTETWIEQVEAIKAKYPKPA